MGCNRENPKIDPFYDMRKPKLGITFNGCAKGCHESTPEGRPGDEVGVGTVNKMIVPPNMYLSVILSIYNLLVINCGGHSLPTQNKNEKTTNLDCQPLDLTNLDECSAVVA